MKNDSKRSLDYKSEDLFLITTMSTDQYDEFLIDSKKQNSQTIGKIQFLISKIDEKIQNQVNKILHNNVFRKLEASWRGILSLVNHINSDDKIKVKLFPISWQELSSDLGKAIDFDHSVFFQKVYSEEFGSPGGEPFGIILGDFEIGNGSPGEVAAQIRTLEQITLTAAASFCPFVSAVNSRLFGLDSYQVLGGGKAKPKIEAHLGAAWERLRKNPDSRFLALIGPKVLYRKPYNSVTNPTKTLLFDEHFPNNDEMFLFGTPIYGFGVLVIKEFAETGWFSGLRGSLENQMGLGLISHIPFESTEIDSTPFSIIPPVECSMTATTEELMDQLGVMCFSPSSVGNILVLHNCPTIHKPEFFQKEIANENAHISALLNYVLCVSRFAHFIKIIGRDKIGSFKTPEDCEIFVNQWIQNYCDSGSSNFRRTPLKFAKVIVSESDEKPGYYRSVIYLQPHLQIDHVSATIKLVTDVSTSK